MVSIYNFLRAPTIEQKNEIDWLCKKGMSTNSFTRSIGAPIQGFTALVFIIMDIPAAPVKGLGNACCSILKGSFREAGHELADGLEIGFRSIFQIAIILGAVMAGILFPNQVYGTLQELNVTASDNQDEELEVGETTIDQQLFEEEIVKLKREIKNLRRRNTEKREIIKNFKASPGEASDEINLTKLMKLHHAEKLQMTEKIQGLQEEVEECRLQVVHVNVETTWCGWLIKGGIGFFSSLAGWQASAIIMAWAPKLILDAAIANQGWVIGGLLVGPAIVKASAPIIALAAGGGALLASTVTAIALYVLVKAIQYSVNAIEQYQNSPARQECLN